MANWTFPTDAQGWSANGGWIASEGRPPGSISIGLGAFIENLSIPVVVGSNISLWARIQATGFDPEASDEITVQFTVSDGVNDTTISGSRTITTYPYEGAWFKIYGATDFVGTVIEATISVFAPVDWPGYVYVDSVYIGEDDPEDISAAKLHYGTNSLQNNISIPRGVWQDGLTLTTETYEPSFGDVFTGTHVGNALHVLKHIYSDGLYGTYNATYNATYCNGAETYTTTYGATYAAVYYRSVLCNVRNLEWI